MTPIAAFRLTAIALALSFCHVLPSFATSTLMISPLGSDVYDLQGVGMEDVAALDITITYDVAMLTNPRISQGNLVSGAMIAVNPNVPGTVRMAIITANPIKGTGTIATLTFDRTGTSPGEIISLSVKLSNINGTSLPALVQVNNPADSSSVASNQSQNQETSTATAGSKQTVAGTSGTSSSTAPIVIIAGPSDKTDDNKDAAGSLRTQVSSPVPPQPVSEPLAESVALAPKTDSASGDKAALSAEKTSKENIYTQKSILERFRDFKSERTPKSLVGLFNHESMIGFSQEPTIILSDGKSTLKVVFIAFAYGKETPKVSLKGARLLSLKKDRDKTNTWIAEMKPDKGVNSATLTVPQDKVTMVFPLTVALKPKMRLGKSDKVTEVDFNKFLSMRGSRAKPRFDLNNDGKRDYVDDYIFTANYLVSRGIGAHRRE